MESDRTPFDAATAPGPWRRRVRMAVVAALAVTAVLAGAAIAAVAWPDGRQSPGGAPAGATAVDDIAAARPAEEVWPDAVVRLVRILPDGRVFFPTARLDAHRYVGTTNRGNVYTLPVIYDAAANEVTELFPAHYVADRSVSLPVVNVSVSERVVVAVARRPADGVTEDAVEVWAAPRSGGAATRRAAFEPRTTVVPIAVGDAVYAAVTPNGQRATTVYRLPAGGSPEEVAKAVGVPHSPYGRWFLTGPPADSPDALPSAPATFVDVITGERRTTTALDGLTDIVCSPETCVGYDDAGAVAYRYDGTNPTRINGIVSRKYPPTIIETGRFIRLWSRAEQYLWDREKGVVAAVSGGGSGVGLLQHCRVHDRELSLLDLSKVP